MINDVSHQAIGNDETICIPHFPFPSPFLSIKI